jgi:hypothetical protein
MKNGMLGGGALANALETSHPIAIWLIPAVMAHAHARPCIGCSRQAAYILARVTTLLCPLPPLHVPRDLAVSSRVMGSIL